jgi:hypothetical protein
MRVRQQRENHLADEEDRDAGRDVIGRHGDRLVKVAG